MKRSSVFILITLLLFSSCGIQKRVKKADKKFAIGEYYIAADMYKSCYGRLNSKKDRELKGYVAYKQGECYRLINNPRAANCYQSALRCKYHLQDSTIFLHCGLVLQYQGKYKDAAKSYSLYLESHPDNYVAQANRYACNKIDEWRKETSRYKVSEAKEFNQKRTSNFAPMFIGDNSDAIMFTSNRQEKSKTGSKKLKRPSNVTGQQLFQLYQTRKNAAGEWEDIELAEGLYDEPENEQKNDTAGGGGKQAAFSILHKFASSCNAQNTGSVANLLKSALRLSVSMARIHCARRLLSSANSEDFFKNLPTSIITSNLSLKYCIGGLISTPNVWRYSSKSRKTS